MKIIKILLFWPFHQKGTGAKKQISFKITAGVFRLLALVPLFYFLSGCFYYKVTTTPYAQSETLKSLSSNNNNFVIHADTNVFFINHVSLQNDTLKGDYLSRYTMPYHRDSFPHPNMTSRYRRNRGEVRLLNEVHLYLHSPNVLQGNKCSVALKDIYRLDVYDPDIDSTVASWVLSALGVLLVSPFILLLLLIVTGNSCPYIYVNTGHGYAFAGEIYSGAVYAPLERDDYLVLPQLVAENGDYKLRITNELQEVQHTNLTELMVVDHPANSEVLIDKYGHCQTGVNIKSPVTATNFAGTDALPQIRYKDSLSYLGASPVDSIPLTDGLIMTFDHPAHADSGKLFIRARNSIWLDNVYKNFHSMLGSYNDKWTDKQNKGNAKEMIDWSVSQKIPLMIYVEKKGKWELSGYYNLAGPMALKEDVIAIDLKGIGEGPVKIKLESGYYFWEIDYVGLDCTPNIPVEVKTVQLDEAITTDNDTVTELLKNNDDKYFVQTVSACAANLSFSVPAPSNSERTIILHSRGYYRIMQSTRGLPQVSKLKKIRESGQFLEYSRELMKAGIDSFDNPKNP